jgi:hypothetical protein
MRSIVELEPECTSKNPKMRDNILGNYLKGKILYKCFILKLCAKYCQNPDQALETEEPEPELVESGTGTGMNSFGSTIVSVKI